MQVVESARMNRCMKHLHVYGLVCSRHGTVDVQKLIVKVKGLILHLVCSTFCCIILVEQRQALSNGSLAVGFPIWSDEWCVVCKLSHIGSDLLISECWHTDLLSSVPQRQNDYFFIISLIFHHYCTPPSVRPNYYCQLPFWKPIMLWMSIISLLWNCPCARAPFEYRDVIFILSMAAPSFHLELFLYAELFLSFCASPISHAVTLHASLCCNLSCLLALFAAIGPTYREWWQCLSHLLFWGKYEETSLSLSKCKRWFAKVKSEFWKITYTDNTSACRIIMADYCMAATIRIMIPITVNTMMKIILKSCQSIMKEEGECKAKKRQSAVY